MYLCASINHSPGPPVRLVDVVRGLHVVHSAPFNAIFLINLVPNYFCFSLSLSLLLSVSSVSHGQFRRVSRQAFLGLNYVRFHLPESQRRPLNSPALISARVGCLFIVGGNISQLIGHLHGLHVSRRRHMANWAGQHPTPLDPLDTPGRQIRSPGGYSLQQQPPPPLIDSLDTSAR